MFSITTNGTIPYPNEMNDNFYHCAQGTILPKAGNYLAITSSVCNIGTSTVVWNTFYGHDMYCSSLVAPNLWVFVAEQIFTANTSRVEFSGLNGDTDGEYLIFSFANILTTSSFYMYLNGNSSYSCAYQFMGLDESIATWSRNSSTSIIINSTIPLRPCSFSIIKLYAKNGFPKTIMLSRISDVGSLTCSKYFEHWYIGQNFLDTTSTNSTLTSLVFTASENFSSKSYISIWKRGS